MIWIKNDSQHSDNSWLSRSRCESCVPDVNHVPADETTPLQFRVSPSVRYSEVVQLSCNPLDWNALHNLN